MKEEISYIAKRYRKGKFSADKGWRRLNITPVFRWRRVRIAAAVASAIVLSATAAVIYHRNSLFAEQDVPAPDTTAISPAEIVNTIDFENATLPEVIASINEIYGVEIVNIPEDADSYHLSLHYEGNAADLVATINEILETEMIVNE